MRPRPQSGSAGVTLVELMVSLSVLAIGLLAGAPSFVDVSDRRAVRDAAEGVVSLISDARAEAVKNGFDVNVAMSGHSTAWCIGANAAGTPTGGHPVSGASACDCSDSSQCVVSGQRFALAGANYPGVQVGGLFTALTFDRRLGIVSSLGERTLTLTSPRRKYDLAVQINPLGQARLCVPAGKPSIAGVPPC